MEQLHTELKALTEMDGHTFFSSIQQTPDGMIVEIFSYHAEPESSWDLPSARECRGIMFEIERDGTPVQLLSRPMHKFFNLDENHLSQREDLKERVLYFTDKHDGSLISTYIDRTGVLRLKSKGSLNSDQASFANRFILRPEYSDLRRELQNLASNGWTVDLEYVGPMNQIVLGYSEPQLIVLSMRNNETGEYVLPHAMSQSSPILASHMSPVNVLLDGKTFDQHIEDMRNERGVEGQIFILEDGERFKVKTKWYFERHSVKDEISSCKKLFSAIIDGKSDDLKHLFVDDPLTCKRVRDFENHLSSITMELISQTRVIVSEIVGMGAGPGAIKAQQLTSKLSPSRHKLLFGLVMQLRKNSDVQRLTKMIHLAVVKNPTEFTPPGY